MPPPFEERVPAIIFTETNEYLMGMILKSQAKDSVLEIWDTRVMINNELDKGAANISRALHIPSHARKGNTHGWVVGYYKNTAIIRNPKAIVFIKEELFKEWPD